MQPARSQPMGIWELVGTAIRVYIANANSMFLIVAVLAVPFTIILTLLLTAALPDELVNFDPRTGDDALSGLTFSDFSSFFVVAIIGGVLGFVVSMVAIGACFVLVGDALQGRSRPWMEAVRTAISKIGSLVWLPLLVGLLLFGGAIAAVLILVLLGSVLEPLAAIGGIALVCAFVYVFVLWSVAVPALMAEDVRGTRALARSGQLLSGRWWPTFGTYVVAFVIMTIVSIILGAVFDRGADPSGADLVITLIGSAVSQILLTPFQAAIVGVVYYDLRARKEPAQAAMASDPTASGPPTPPPAPPAP